MTEAEYREALIQKARELYTCMIEDPLQVPLIRPENAEYYPKQFKNSDHALHWIGIVEELQIVKPDFV